VRDNAEAQVEAVGSDPRLKPVAKLRSCGCDEELAKSLHDWPQNKDSANDCQFIRVMSSGVIPCHGHLRLFARQACGLLNGSCKRERLLKRLTTIYESPLDLEGFRRENPTWFNKSCRPPNEGDDLVVYRFRPVSPEPFVVTSALVLMRFGGPSATEEWERNGSMILPGVMGHLRRKDVLDAIDTEFDMYSYHSRPVPGHPAKEPTKVYPQVSNISIWT
jgi:hypothetical protein